MRPLSPDRRLAVALGLACVTLYLLVGGGRFFSVDEVGAFQLTRFLATAGDQAIAASTVTLAGPEGRHWNLQGPLLSLLALPLYAVGALAARLLPIDIQRALAGPTFEGDPGVVWSGDLRIVVVSCSNALVTAALIGLYFLLVRRLGARRRWAFAAALLLGTCTLLFAHSKNFFSHSLVALTLLAALGSLLEAQRSANRRWLIGAGIAAGLMVLTRVQSAVLVVPLALFAGLAMPGGSSASARLRRVGRFGIPAAAALLLVAVYNAVRFGTPLEAGYTHFDSFGFRFLESIPGHLVSVGRSIVLYSPPLGIAAWAWPGFARRHPSATRLVGGLSLALLSVYASWSAWHGAWCYGNRYLLPLVAPLALPLPWALAAAWRHGWVGRAFVVAIAAAGLLVQVLGLGANIAFVHHAFRFAEHPDAMPYLWVPAQSQLAAHWQVIGGHDELWLGRLAAASVGAASVAVALALLPALVGGLLVVRGSRAPTQSSHGEA